VFGASWESTIWVHRWLGYAFLVLVFLHMALFWKVRA
jgi:hypothetical protein